MSELQAWVGFVLISIVLPPLCIGIVRKVKARLQNRIGASIWQPFFHFAKLLRKREVLSDTMSGVFRLSTVFGLAAVLIASWLLPWLSCKPLAAHVDLFFILYFLATIKMFTLLGALDAGSPFGAFAASREATLNFLLEPAVCLALCALAIGHNTADLQSIFAQVLPQNNLIWVFAGIAIFLASLIELSRMPVDDPTTHLELTMVHEAMILEASGRNLLLLEYSYSLKTTLLWGLSTQCLLRFNPAFFQLNAFEQQFISCAGILLMAVFVGLLESLIVKLQWRKVLEFIAYVMTVSLVCAFVSLAVKIPA